MPSSARVTPSAVVATSNWRRSLQVTRSFDSHTFSLVLPLLDQWHQSPHALVPESPPNTRRSVAMM
ncbi:hypothetical protein [Microbacterium halotolerans]|uniref:hypothetical protein n=1 Tax=Microbacterium halotolerans TaxID=246613 RepID=UPI000E6ADC3C|nr:hypothetical protein [Microbacterium halotolerans]